MKSKNVEEYFDTLGKRFSSIYDVRPCAGPDKMVQIGDMRITVITDRMLRIELAASGNFLDKMTQTVINRDFATPSFKQEGDTIKTDYLTVNVKDSSLANPKLSVDVKGFGTWHLGEKPWTLKGTARTLDSTHGWIELSEGLMAECGFSILEDSKTLILTDDGSFVERQNDHMDIYFFGYGHDFKGCIKDFYHLAGPTPLLPRFTLGNWWSRYYKYDEKTYLDLMDKFREKNIPFSVAVIDMDWHLVDVPEKYGSGWTGFSWNRELFPDPARFLKGLHDRGMKASINMHPADGVREYEDQYENMASAMGIDPKSGEAVEFDITNKDFVKAYFEELHYPLEEEGVDFFWMDWQQGTNTKMEGADPLWMLNHLHYLDRAKDNEPMVFSRYAGPGSHRYPIGFSGDTVSNWDSFSFQPYFTATASNIGYSWWSHDIGGHMMGKTDPELITRWMEFGVFSPINRLHSTSNIFYHKEPWAFDILHEKIMSDYLRMRHRLIPYLYAMNYRTSLFGEPLIRPMYWENDVDEAYHHGNEYYFGSELIVAPITSPIDPASNLAHVSVYLPEGKWRDAFTGNIYQGGKTIDMYRPLDKIPVLMKEGAIVPLTDCIEDNQIENPKEIRLEVFAGKPSEFELYEDLGDLSTKAITKIKYDGSDKISYETEGCLDAIPTDRTYKVHIHKEREEDLSEQIYNLLLNANMEYDKKQEIYYAALEESQDKFNKLMQANPDLSYVFFAIRELLDTLEN